MHSFENGAEEVQAYITHGVLSKADQRIDSIDSIPQYDNKKIKVEQKQFVECIMTNRFIRMIYIFGQDSHLMMMQTQIETKHEKMINFKNHNDICNDEHAKIVLLSNPFRLNFDFLEKQSHAKEW